MYTALEFESEPYARSSVLYLNHGFDSHCGPKLRTEPQFGLAGCLESRKNERVSAAVRSLGDVRP